MRFKFNRETIVREELNLSIGRVVELLSQYGGRDLVHLTNMPLDDLVDELSASLSDDGVNRELDRRLREHGDTRTDSDGIGLEVLR